MCFLYNNRNKEGSISSLKGKENKKMYEFYSNWPGTNPARSLATDDTIEISSAKIFTLKLTPLFVPSACIHLNLCLKRSFSNCKNKICKDFRPICLTELLHFESRTR